jgi:hypothetical protein
MRRLCPRSIKYSAALCCTFLSTTSSSLNPITTCFYPQSNMKLYLIIAALLGITNAKHGQTDFGDSCKKKHEGQTRCGM